MNLSLSSLILVAVINKPRDLEVARLVGWYRIPLRSAPKVVAVDYLALYQTGAFGAEKWRINYVAPVRGHELTTRLDLLQDEPDHPYAHHEYYKLQLGPLEPLAQPIPANKGRRITFFYTIGEYLLSASTIDDLVVRSQERQTLWHALRERALQSQAGVDSPDDAYPELELDPVLLASLLGLSGAGRGYKTR